MLKIALSTDKRALITGAFIKIVHILKIKEFSLNVHCKNGQEIQGHKTNFQCKLQMEVEFKKKVQLSKHLSVNQKVSYFLESFFWLN